MLGKLLKYELRATGRMFGLIYAVLLLFALLNRVFLMLNLDNPYISFISGLTMMAYVLGIVAVFAVTLLIALNRFYKNLLGDEGYLMFTLPVRPWMLITSKLIVSVLWVVLSLICTVLSVVIISATPALWNNLWDAVNMLMQKMPDILRSGVPMILFELVIIALTAIASSFLQFYLAMAFGQLSSRHRLATSAGAYIVINIVIQIVTTIILVSGGIYINAFGLDSLTNLLQSRFIQLGLLAIIVWNCAFGALYFAGTNHLLSRRLNLE